MKCQFCKAIFADKDEVQLHQVSSCPAIEKEIFTGINHPCVNVILRWNSDGGIASPSNVYVLLSDQEEQIELYRSDNGCYLSHKISIQVGKYVGQIVADDEMCPIKAVKVDLESKLIDLKIDERTAISRNQVDTELRRESYDIIPSKNSDKSRIKQTQTVHVPYRMNEKSALAKKMIACDKDCYKLEMKSGCCRIDFSTAAFECFKHDVNEYIRSSKVYKIVEDKLFVDLDGREPQDTLKVWSMRDDSEFLFTINLYRTKSNAMINGAKYRVFVDEDLPVLLKMLVERKEVIDEANNQFKIFIPDAIDALNHENEAIDSYEKEKTASSGALMTRRNRKKKIYEGYDVSNTSRRTRNSIQESSVDNEESENCEGTTNNGNDWESEPKFWDTFGEHEWTVTIAKSRNGPKSCVNCNKNNSNNMVRCDGCGSWCHFKCIPAHTIWKKDQDFLCSTCNEKDKAMWQRFNADDELSDSRSTKTLQDEIICLDGADTAPFTDIQSNVNNEEEEADKLSLDCEKSSSQIVYGCEPIPSEDGNMEKCTVLNKYIREISSWYQQMNFSIGQMVKGEAVSIPDFQMDGCCIYYNDPPVYESNEMQLVISQKGRRGVDIVHIDRNESHISVDDLANMLRGMKGDYKDLFTIILKQKRKLDEMKNMHNMTMLPDAIMSHINFISQKLVEKERKIKDLDETNKKGKLEIVEVKSREIRERKFEAW